LPLDTLIQTLVGVIVGIAGGIAIGAMAIAVPKASIWGAAILVLFFFLLYFGYFAIFEIIWNGQRLPASARRAFASSRIPAVLSRLRNPLAAT